LITAKQIRKNYGNLEVLKGVDLHVDKGEIVSIVGPSGAGKTTLLQILGTLDFPSQGELSINERSLYQLSNKEIAAFRNKEIGFVFQFHHLLPEFNAWENVAIPAFISKQNKDEGHRKSKELLSYFGLSERLTHKPAELSGGEQQRVAVARALVNEPSVILADEPSGNLDTQTAEELHQMFLKLRKEIGQTFVIVTHNESLAAMADRRITLQDGIMVEEELLNPKKA